MAIASPSYGTLTALTVTNLNSLASSATAGWQSERIDNRTTLALDYAVSFKISLSSTATTNDKAIYCYVSTATHDGTSWYHDDQGTTTTPTGTQGTTTIGNPNNLKLLGVLAYTATGQVCQGTFLLSNAVGQYMPHGFSIIVINFTGANTLGSGNVVQYVPIGETIV